MQGPCAGILTLAAPPPKIKTQVSLLSLLSEAISNLFFSEAQLCKLVNLLIPSAVCGGKCHQSQHPNQILNSGPCAFAGDLYRNYSQFKKTKGQLKAMLKAMHEPGYFL